MKIAEPTTAITDYLLAGELVFFGILMLRTMPALPGRLWAFSFFVLAVAAAAGGTHHGFIASMSSFTAQVIWKTTLYAIGIATLMMLLATLLVYIPQPWKNIFMLITVLQFFFYVYVMSGTNDFRYVIYNYVPAMIAILLMALFHRNLWLVGAVLISFAGAAVQRSGLILHRHFNFNDIYHVIQMIAMYLFYRGGVQMLK